MSQQIEDAEANAAMDRRMELTQLKAGDVLTAENAAEIQAMFDEQEEEIARMGDALQAERTAGRMEAGGAEVAELLKRIDELTSKLSVQRSMSRFWRLLGERKAP